MKMKKLLASALAAAMVISSMVGTLVTSAADTVGTITAGSVTATVGETDTITADINIAFPDGVVAPHNIITVALDGYTLSAVTLGDVTYTSTTEGVVEIDADGSNLASGKILLECPVDSKAPTVTNIKLTVTFVDSDETDTIAGTYDIVVSGDDMTDVSESDIAITAVNGTLTVVEPHVCSAGTPVSNNDGTHYIPCADACGKNYAETTACTYVDGACSVCGYAEPVVEPECEHANITYVSSVVGTSITYACDDCGVEFTKEITYNKYARAGYISANAEEQTLISFGAYYSKDFSRVDSAADWDQLFIVLDHTRGDEEIGSEVYGYADVEDDTSNSMYKVYYGLAAFMYADDITATVYLHDSVSDVWYSGPQNKSSLKALAESMIPSATGIQQSMWVDLLNYGAAAQVNFEVNTENLANADISDYQSVATTPAEYTKTPIYAKGSDPTPMYYYMFTGAVESKICLRSYIRFPSNYTGTYTDLTSEDIKVVATWTNFAGEEKTYEEVMTDEALVSGYTNRWSFFLPLGAPDLRTDVTFTVYNGDTLISTETVTSFEAYVTENYASANDNFKSLCDAMMAFGDSVNEYLTSK